MNTLDEISSRRGWMNQDTKAEFLGFTLAIKVRPERGSVIETSACLWPRPMMVSSSQPPTGRGINNGRRLANRHSVN